MGHILLLACAHDLNVVGGNINTVKKNKQTLFDAGMETGIETYNEKTKFMLLSRHRNAGQIRDIKIANRSFENVSQFKNLGTTVTDIKLI
jgi:hypothetical protein